MNPSRLTEDERKRAVELIRAIYRRPDGGAGCCLHCLLDDGNFADQFLAGCEETAIERGHADCAELCRILKKAKRTQREKLTRQGHWLYDPTTPGCPGYESEFKAKTGGEDADRFRCGGPGWQEEYGVQCGCDKCAADAKRS